VAAALPAIVSVAGRALVGEPLAVQEPVADLPSKLRSHPTAWTWARHALRGVR
jgi:hypothetical protein